MPPSDPGLRRAPALEPPRAGWALWLGAAGLVAIAALILTVRIIVPERGVFVAGTLAAAGAFVIPASAAPLLPAGAPLYVHEGGRYVEAATVRRGAHTRVARDSIPARYGVKLSPEAPADSAWAVVPVEFGTRGARGGRGASDGVVYLRPRFVGFLAARLRS
jgi:hypothetical protein